MSAPTNESKIVKLIEVPLNQIDLAMLRVTALRPGSILATTIATATAAILS